MKLKKIIPIAIGAVSLLAAGQFTMAQTPADEAAPPPCHHQGPHNMGGMLSHALKLTDAQKAQIDPMVKAIQPQLEAIHQQARTQADATLKQLHAQIRPLLTPEQQKKLDALETLHGSGPE